MILIPQHHDSISLDLHLEKPRDFYDIPSGKEVVYNDKIYCFLLSGISILPTEVCINDETYDIELCQKEENQLLFKLKNNERPFLQSFGAVRIEIILNGQQYYSNSIAVMVSNTVINNGVMNMVQYIYDHCEKYLYEEHKHSSIATSIKESEIISLEAKIAFLQEALKVYKQCYQQLKNNPYSKLKRAEQVDSFDKLQTISLKTIQYISSHSDELTIVNYNTGIRFNNQYYQPNRVLIEHNIDSFDVYENKVILGFLKTIISEISVSIKDLSDRTYTHNRTIERDGYFDSMYQIFSRSIKKIVSYINALKELQQEYNQLYFHYNKLFNIPADAIKSPPVFTPVFRSIQAYRQLYQTIYNWFSIGNYNLGKEELLLSFISTSKIYEYYCLIKILHFICTGSEFELIESKHLVYHSFFNNAETKYNNTFVFQKNDVKLTLYFQPIIYGNNRATNGITLFRNTSTNSRTDFNQKGKTYSPDYIIKIEQADRTQYIIMDAKFSSPDNIRLHQLQELVYKYLFSLSPLNNKDSIIGLYILCGKTTENDMPYIIHDIAQKMNYNVSPFAEILVMNGKWPDDYTIPSQLLAKATSPAIENH